MGIALNISWIVTDCMGKTVRRICAEISQIHFAGVRGIACSSECMHVLDTILYEDACVHQILRRRTRI